MSPGSENSGEMQSSSGIISTNVKRWLMAALLGILTIVVSFLTNLFGIVNNIYVSYFHISYIAVDWFTVIQLPGSMVADIIIAAIIYNNGFGIRKLSIGVGLCCITTSSLLLVASQIPSAFPIIYFGELLMGISYAMSISTIGQLAKYWFSVGHAGTVLATIPSSHTTGTLIAILVSSNILVSPNQLGVNNTSEKFSNLTETNQQEWHSKTMTAFLYIFIILFAISLIMFLLILILFENKAPENQLHESENSRLLSNSNASESVSGYKRLVLFLKEWKRIFSDKTFLLLSLVAIVRYGNISINNMFFSEILRPIFSSLFFTKSIDPNVSSGHLLVVYKIVTVVSHFLSGKFYDWYRKTFFQMLLSLLILVMAALVMGIALHFYSLIGIWISVLCFGIGTPMMHTPIYNSVLQCFPGTDPGYVFALFSFIMFGGGIVITQISRIVLDFGGGIGVSVLQLIIAVCAIGVSIVLRSKLA